MPIQEARSATYRLLARLALVELNGDFAAALLEMPILGKALADSGGLEALPALRVEYTRLFLMNAHPYESVYLDESGMLNTVQSGTVLEHYREQGFEPEALSASGAPDHLGLELEFMAHLIESGSAAHRHGDGAVAASLSDHQLHFLEGHLLKWGPIFASLLSELADSPFYRAYGEMLEAFLLKDHQALAT